MDNLISSLVRLSKFKTFSKSNRQLKLEFTANQLPQILKTWFHYYLQSEDVTWRDLNKEIQFAQVKAFFNNQFIGSKRDPIDEVFKFLSYLYSAYEGDLEAIDHIDNMMEDAQVSSNADNIDWTKKPKPSDDLDLTFIIPTDIDIAKNLKDDLRDAKTYQSIDHDNIDINDVRIIHDTDDKEALRREHLTRQELRELVRHPAVLQLEHSIANQLPIVNDGPLLFHHANMLNRAVDESGLAAFLDMFDWI